MRPLTEALAETRDSIRRAVLHLCEVEKAIYAALVAQAKAEALRKKEDRPYFGGR